ncbi:hypothetical protein ACUTAF_01835 [Pseudomonas sp. SP16.1]|uniref:hypothetical protein n=1 Tax=Pseudomonas sp. SP16.1 TaxID=3458854 RepID=UPI004045873F
MTIQANAQHLPGLELAWAELHAAGYQPGDAPHKILAQAIAAASADPECDRSACGDYSPGPCDNPDCPARRDKPAPAVVNQQLTTAVCLWKREQDSVFYETSCGQVWYFTVGSTPEENSAYFCHHCGKSLEVQRLVAYQVGDNDIVAAYDPAGAIQVLVDFAGYGEDFDESDVEPVSDKVLDATEAFDQDEGKIIPLEKTLRQQLAELTEPAYLHGWE